LLLLLKLLLLLQLTVPHSRWTRMHPLQQRMPLQQRLRQHLSRQTNSLQLLTKRVRRPVRLQVLMPLQHLLRMVWMWISRLQQRLQLRRVKLQLLMQPLRLRSRLRRLLVLLQRQLPGHQLPQQQHRREQSERGSGRSSVRKMHGCRQLPRGLWLSLLRLLQSAGTWTMTLR
jgi:hypothetical protein